MKPSPALCECGTCRKVKPLESFPINKVNTNHFGRSYRCRECGNASQRKSYLRHAVKRLAYQKKWRKEHPEFVSKWRREKYLKHRFKHDAVMKLNYAVKNGLVIKEPCRVCGDKKSQGHHEDYRKPLSVIWLCDYHHREIHGRIVRTKYTPKKRRGRK